MKLSTISYKVDSIVKIPISHNEDIGGIEVRVNDCQGLIKKDIRTKIKNGDMYLHEIKELQFQDFYNLPFDYQGKKYNLQIPLVSKSRDYN